AAFPDSSQFFFFTDPAPTVIYTLSLHDALPILSQMRSTNHLKTFVHQSALPQARVYSDYSLPCRNISLYLIVISVNQFILSKLRSEEHTSELQSRGHLVCRHLLEKKKPPIS